MSVLKRFGVAIFLFGLFFCSCEKKDHQNNSTGGNHSSAAGNDAVSESEKLKDFTLKSLAGETVNLRGLEGQKVVIVNFWATWCGPCRREIPDFNEVYSRYRDRGVEILGVSVDQEAENVVPPFLRGNPMAYPVLLGSPELTYEYGIRGLPTTFIIDRSGKIASRIVGMTSAARLEAELAKLL
jgi:peroxiredoxin